MTSVIHTLPRAIRCKDRSGVHYDYDEEVPCVELLGTR